MILPPMHIEIYSKPDCHLCDEAKAVLRTAQRRIPFTLAEIDIQSDPALFERYRYDIPVVFIDGHKAFKHRIDPKRLEQRLRREAGAPIAEPGPDDG